MKTGCNLKNLPPTEEATNEHLLRVYLQIQKWLGDEEIDPRLFGWEDTINGLMPITMRKQPIPQEILEILACQCKAGCKDLRCRCRKFGLQCTSLCEYCGGINCRNCTECTVVTEEENREVEEDDIDESDTDSSCTDISESEPESECESLQDNVPDLPVQIRDEEENGDKILFETDSESETELYTLPSKKYKTH